MSRLRQRRLQQLKQTVCEKVELLSRQREELMTVLDEYLEEAQSSASQLLSLQDADTSDSMYLDMIRQLDRRSQVCIQLISKTYEIIEADEADDQFQDVDDQTQNLSQVKPVSKAAPADYHRPLAANTLLADASPKIPHHTCPPVSSTSMQTQSDNSYPHVPAPSSLSEESIPAPPAHRQPPVSNASSNVGASSEAPDAQRESAAVGSSGTDFVSHKLPEGTPTRVVVSSVENPWSFCVLTSAQDVVNLSEKIRKSIEQQTKSLETIQKGTICLAEFTDGFFYRACVQHVQDDFVEVLFIDFGNTHSCNKSLLHSLPPELQRYPALAIHCCLAGVMPKSRSGLWPDEAISLFSQSLNQEVVCEVLWQAPPGSSIPAIVNLTWPAPASSHTVVSSEVASMSMSAYLINQNVAQAIDLPALRSCLLDVKPAGADKQVAVAPDVNKVSGKMTACPNTSLAAKENVGICPTGRVCWSGRVEPGAADSKSSGKGESCQNNMPGLSKTLGMQKATSTGVKLMASEMLGEGAGIKHAGTNWLDDTDADADADVNKMARRMSISSDVSLPGLESVYSSSSSGVHQPRKVLPFVTAVRNDKVMPCQQVPIIFKRPEVQNIRGVRIEKVVASEAQKKPLRRHDTAVSQPKRNVAKMADSQLKESLHRNDGDICRTGSESDNDDKWSASSKSDSVYDEMDICDKMEKFKAFVSAVENPSDFYLHKVCRETGHILLRLMEELNKEFEHMTENILQDYSRQLMLKTGALCCARFTQDNTYYRAIILETRTDPTSKSFISCELEVHVFYIDYGNTEWLAVSRVYPLSKDYCAVPAQALWCSLASIQPAGLGQKVEWSPQAVSAFTQLTGQEKILTVYVVSGDIPGNALSRGCAVQTSPLEVLLIDEADDNLCINHELLLHGHAVIKPLPSTSEARKEQSLAVSVDGDDDDRWDGMKKDASSLSNTYNVDIGDVGVATTGIKESGRNKAVCKYFNRPSQCWKGNKCKFLHMKPGMHTSMSGNLKQVLVYDEDQSDILPKAGTSVVAEVTAGQNPCFFYVVLPWGPYSVKQVTDNAQEVLDYVKEETLHSLNTAVQSFYKNKRLDTDNLVYGKGEAVVARSGKSGVWLRAKVIDTDPDKEEVQVLYVDFGDMEWVSEHDIRQLELQFIHLPPQAVECSLNGVVPKRPQVSWTEKASARFMSLVQGKTLVAHVVTSTSSTRLVVDLWDTSGSEDMSIADILVQEGLASRATADDNDRPRQTADCGDLVPGGSRRATAHGLKVCYGPG